MSDRITIKRTKKPLSGNINNELQWFCDSLGLFGNRDRDKSCFRMFIILIRELHAGEGLSSDELSDRVGLSRGTVVHHLNKLMESGLVVHRRKKYMIRVNNMTMLVDEIERDLLRTIDDIKKVAENIDSRLNL